MSVRIRGGRRPSRRIRPLAPALLVLGLAAFQYWGGAGWRPNPLREGLPVRGGVTDRRFTFCRLLYESVRSEPLGHGWNTDYPTSDSNFMMRISQLTTTAVSRWADGQPGHAVVRATQDELFECPFLFVSDAGTVGFSDLEAARLREYLLKGGFLYADDFWGDWAWEHWLGELRKVLPEHPMVDVEAGHPLMTSLYRIPEVPQVPSIQFWRRRGRQSTSERGHESSTPHFRAIVDEDGRALVVMTHNTDIADGWEREGEDEDFFYNFSPEAYAVGINIAIYAMSR